MKKILPHFCIVMSLMFMTLLVIDQVNSAMGFISSQLTQILMLAVFPVIITTMGLYIADSRRFARRYKRKYDNHIENAEHHETGESEGVTKREE